MIKNMLAYNNFTSRFCFIAHKNTMPNVIEISFTPFTFFIISIKCKINIYLYTMPNYVCKAPVFFNLILNTSLCYI